MNRELLDGKQEIAEFPGPDADMVSLHTDLEAAHNTITKIRVLEKEFRVHTALAHDASWLKEGTNRVLMSLLDDDLKAAAKDRIPHDYVA